MQDFIVIDIETSGVIPGKHQILSIGAICSKTGERFYEECRIYKWNKIEQSALKVNGFTELECRDETKPTPKQIYNKFKKWCLGRSNILAGHNIGSFDVQFLKMMEKGEWMFKYHYIDLHSMAFCRFGESLSHKNIAIKLGLDPEPTPHNALGGAISEYNCIIKLLSL